MNIKRILRLALGKGNKKNEYVSFVSTASGLSYDEAKAKMDEAKKMGISYKYFAKRRLWNSTDSQLENAARMLDKKRNDSLEIKETAIQHVIDATGWSYKKTAEKMSKARKNCGSSSKDYYKFELYKLTPEQQREYFTNGVFEKLMFKYNPDPEAVHTLLYKGRFAIKYRDLLNRKWFINRDLSFDEFCEKVEGLDKLICKPLASTQGKGITLIKFDEYPDMKAVYDDIFARIKLLCEECIVQHPAIAAFNPSSVNTLRVLTIVDQGKCHHVYAGFRMGRGNLVDNFHAGGIIASVDTATGITCMDAIDLDGNHYPKHPVSGLDTLGFQIPNWQAVLDITEKAALRLEGAAMVGWDVAVTPDGACLVEGNSEPSHIIIQLPYVRDGVGMKKLVSKFL